jgi:outer membrane protein OmpA-like peptidoglycan-associated protein
MRTLLGLFIVVTGCSSHSSQLATIQQEKEQLLTTIRNQRDSNRTLQDQVASLETRLDQAEKELARGGATTRLSSRPSETPPATRSDNLPWRMPDSKGKSDPPTKNNSRTSSTMSASSDASLLSLARRDRRLHYDAAAHAARVDLPVEFDDQAATITGEGKRQLDGLAKLLKSDEARDFRVMVTGLSSGRQSTTDPRINGEQRFASARQLGTARAQAVADYLDRHGIAQERLAVSGTGAREAVSSGSGVQIYLLESDAPVVGWSPPSHSVR